MQARTVLESTSPHRRLPFRILTFLDLAGLAMLTALFTLRDPQPAAESQYIALLVVGLGAWLLAAQVRTLNTILKNSRNYALLAPAAAVLVVTLMREVTGEYFSAPSAIAFAVSWTAWMVACRVARSYFLSPVRILTIGSADVLAELVSDPNVSIRVANTPPDSSNGFDVVALDPAANYSDEWLRWLLHADLAGVKIISAPLIIETLTRRLPLDALHGKWAHFLVGQRRPYVDWKRLADVALVLLAAPLWLPVLGVVLLAVYLDDGGPVLFWQQRVGQYKRPFRMAKVRSMRVGADHDGPTFAGTNDPRVTRVGRFIRRYRLDELPQFWNVLKGDMSLIGPRPEQLCFSEEFEQRFPLYSLRYNLRPGITGWAQVRQGYTADADETFGKLRHDLYYVRHVSPLLDAEIAVRTLGVLFSGFGAR